MPCTLPVTTSASARDARSKQMKAKLEVGVEGGEQLKLPGLP